MAAELGQQTVEFSALVKRTAEDSYLSLKELVDKSAKSAEERPDSEKKIDLLKFIAKTRQRMLRLHVLAKWCQQVPLVHYCQQLASTLSSHDTCFTQTADSLFYMYDGLQHARAPIFDVPSAIEVLLTGGYQRLPKCVEDIGTPSTLPEDQQKPALKKLDMLLRSKLLEVSLPKEIPKVTVSDGTAVLHVDGEFKVFLTLGYRGHLSMWRILHLELLVGEKNGPVKLEETRRYALGEELERRMAAAENPLMLLYTILHELCVALVMDTVIRQVQMLRQGRWKDAIRFELIYDGNAGQGGNASASQMSQDSEFDSNGQKIPGLKIIYWLDFEKNPGGSDSISSPSLKIETGQDLQIKCLHSPFVLDPLTDKEAEFSLDQSCIDVEKLLLRAIACSKHTRLLEIQRELSKNVQVCQVSGDIILKSEGGGADGGLRKDGKFSVEGYSGDEILRVRAYGTSYITLGINIRNGRFLLQSSENILLQSSLKDYEEALNLGSTTATEVFLSLRRKSILHLFASTGRFLGLKVYDQGLTALKIPKLILHGVDLLLMGFPHCGGSYYLLMQLDKDFKPILNLLEAQDFQGGKSYSVSDINQVIRFNKIDVSQMQMIEDELNLSLLDWERLHSPNVGVCNQISEHGLLPEFGLENSLQLPGCSQSSFSSIVDDVFELDKGASGPSFPIQGQHSLSSNTSPFSHVSSPATNHQRLKPGVSSPKWEGAHHSQASTNSSLYLSNSLKGLLHNGATNSLSSSSPVRNSSIQKLSSSKSEQDLTSIKSPRFGEAGQYSAVDEDQTRSLNESPKDAASLISKSRLIQLSPLRTNGPRAAGPSAKPNGVSIAATSHSVDLLRNVRLGSSNVAPICQTSEPGISHTSDCANVPKHETGSAKRSLPDILMLIPSFQVLESNPRPQKRRKVSEEAYGHPATSQAPSSGLTCKSGVHMYGSLLAEVNHGRTPSNVYVSVLLHVVRHCSLCIKHAQLTCQMDSLDIPYVEEVGLRTPSSNLWVRLPFVRDDSWQNICLRLGKPGSMCWDVKINDPYFRELWELQKGSNSTPWGSGIRIANTSDIDSHIHYDPDGVILSYKTVEADSIKKLVSDLRRLSNARLFARGMRKLIGVRAYNKLDDMDTVSESKTQYLTKGTSDADYKLSEQMRRTFKIEAVGLMSLWFSYSSLPVMAQFVVEWEAGKEGCTMHVSPDHLWPHTKFLEDFINGAEVASFLDCIRLTAGPLLALAAAIPPARTPGPVSTGPSTVSKQNSFVQSQGLLPNASSLNIQPVSSASLGAITAPLGNHSLHSAAMLSAAGRGASGIFPSSLLPIDVSVVLRGPYWIRIIYRKKFAVDMRCFAGDQVWLQPATPPKGGPAAGGSLPCPQFRPFIMEHVAQGLNALDPSFPGGPHAGGHTTSSNANHPSGSQLPATNTNRTNLITSGMPRATPLVGSQVAGGLNRASNALLASSGISGVPLRISPGTGVPVHVRGELNTAFIGLGDDGGYGGGWVPLAALKKVLRGILKYLGVLWLFAQLPDLLEEILGSILNKNEGALLNLDQEQPALRFFVGGYVFAVSVHRVQLLLQVLSVKRFHHQQPQQQTLSNAQEELAPAEINEICDYFSRRVASEPYDASRVASFITLLTLPISVLREFLKLISWKKGLSQAHGGEIASAQKARVELCLENHSGSVSEENSGSSSTSKSNIHHDRARNSVDFALTFVLDHTHIPQINAAGGAAWLPYCVSVRLKYSFGDSTHISFLGMDGSHGGRACWLRLEDWEKCKQRVARSVEYVNGPPSVGDVSQGRLRSVAETLQRALQSSLQQPRDGALSSSSIIS